MRDQYIGIDLHKAFFQACAVAPNGERLWEDRFPRSADGLAALTARCTPTTAMAVEASTPTWHFADTMTPAVGDLRVVDPFKTKLKAGYGRALVVQVDDAGLVGEPVTTDGHRREPREPAEARGGLDVEQHGQVRPQVSRRPPEHVLELGSVDGAAGALVGHRAVDVPVGDHDGALGQRRSDDLLDVLGLVGGVQQCLGAVGVSGVKSSEDAQVARAGIAAIGL